MSTKRFGCLGFGLVILLAVSLFLNFVLVIASSRKLTSGDLRIAEVPRWDEVVLEKPRSGSHGKIAQIDLQGLISSSIEGLVGRTMVDDVKIALRQAAADNSVKAIVLHVNSPGGEVTASDAIYHSVKEARKLKPVVVYMGSVAASGGYYVSCGGSYLMANDTTITGSIGVIISTLNYQGLLGKIGIDPIVFKSGKFKDILSGSREMTPEEKKYIQSLVMQIYAEFVGIVSRERDLPIGELRNGLADGRILSGRDAVAGKLIDATGYIEDAYEKARALGNAPGAEVISYRARFNLGRLFRILGASETKTIELKLPDEFLPKLEPGRAYLLPGYLFP